MKTIQSLALYQSPSFTLSMPASAEIFKVADKNGYHYVWYTCDIADIGRRVMRQFMCVSTAQHFDAAKTVYIGSADQGMAEWHYFEKIG